MPTLRLTSYCLLATVYFFDAGASLGIAGTFGVEGEDGSFGSTAGALRGDGVVLLLPPAEVGGTSVLTLTARGSLPQAESDPRFERITSKRLRMHQTAATTMVIRVNTSPALVPKALEPPTPPNA